ncbi:Hypothetical_protein [Hexamita inflata]|uniref:Hypothetical_protein n=1 Tax=Hexamita inflata TaxID=28002 RepID=A0AA86NUA1_9EUKA|nr:Hypothetical protein HINF_LOCUS13519 [Hexamita inflata]
MREKTRKIWGKKREKTRKHALSRCAMFKQKTRRVIQRKNPPKRTLLSIYLTPLQMLPQISAPSGIVQFKAKFQRLHVEESLTKKIEQQLHVKRARSVSSLSQQKQFQNQQLDKENQKQIEYQIKLQNEQRIKQLSFKTLQLQDIRQNGANKTILNQSLNKSKNEQIQFESKTIEEVKRERNILNQLINRQKVIQNKKEVKNTQKKIQMDNAENEQRIFQLKNEELDQKINMELEKRKQIQNVKIFSLK